MDLKVFAPLAGQAAPKAEATSGPRPEPARGPGEKSFDDVVAGQDSAAASRAKETETVAPARERESGEAPEARDAARDAEGEAVRAGDAEARPVRPETANAHAAATLAGAPQAAPGDARPAAPPLVAPADGVKAIARGASLNEEDAGEENLTDNSPDIAQGETIEHSGAEPDAQDELLIDEAAIAGDTEADADENASPERPAAVAQGQPEIAGKAAMKDLPEAATIHANEASAIHEKPLPAATPVHRPIAAEAVEAAADEGLDDVESADAEPTVEEALAPRPASEKGVAAHGAPAEKAALLADGMAATRESAANASSGGEIELEAASEPAAPREPRRGVEAPATERAAPAAAAPTAASPAVPTPTAAGAAPTGLEAMQAAAQTAAPAPNAPIDGSGLASQHQPVPTPESQRAAQPVIAALRGREGAQTIEIRLDPAELGRVEIDIKYEGDRVTVAVRADRDDALDLLRRHGSDFLKELKESGVDVSNMSFERRDQGQSAFGGETGGQSEAGERWNAARAIQTEDAALAETAQSMAAERSLRVGGQLGLDLRV